MTPVLMCYRLDATVSYDEESVWAFVQRHGGMLSIRGDCIDFWIPRDYSSLLVLAWPRLRRQSGLDYL